MRHGAVQGSAQRRPLSTYPQAKKVSAVRPVQATEDTAVIHQSSPEELGGGRNGYERRLPDRDAAGAGCMRRRLPTEAPIPGGSVDRGKHDGRPSYCPEKSSTVLRNRRAPCKSNVEPRRGTKKAGEKTNSQETHQGSQISS